MQKKLESQLNNGRLKKTGNSYTTDSMTSWDYSDEFEAQRHEEYEYKGKRYIRVGANFYDDFADRDEGELPDKVFTLSNKGKYRDYAYVWVEVEPIKWLVSEKDKMMITEKLVFAGVQFRREIRVRESLYENKDYFTEEFEETDIKKFMDDFWSKDIEQVRSKRKNYGN